MVTGQEDILLVCGTHFRSNHILKSCIDCTEFSFMCYAWWLAQKMKDHVHNEGTKTEIHSLIFTV